MTQNLNTTLLTRDIFLLEGQNISVVYSPLDSKAFLVKKEGIQALKDYYLNGSGNVVVKDFLSQNGIGKSKVKVKKEKDSYVPMDVTLSLTSACNLRCLYCYARAGEYVETMSFDLAKAGIDIVIENLKRRNLDKLKIVFHGGGEALVVFPLLKEITEYAKRVWKGEIKFLLVTNGTLIDSEKAKWFKENNFYVSVSMDGPKDIQDELRPRADGSGSYDDCIKGMYLLRENGVKFGIRATITKRNVDRIEEMLDIARNFEVTLKIEPVTPTGRGEYGVEELSSDDFLIGYNKAREYANANNQILKSSYDNELIPKLNYCGGNGRMFCILPDGNISSCSRVTREDDKFSERFFVGKLSKESICVDQGVVKSLKTFKAGNFEDCRGCFAKWYCAGGCHNTRLSNGGSMPKEHCEIMKSLLWQKLITQVTELGRKG